MLVRTPTFESYESESGSLLTMCLSEVLLLPSDVSPMLHCRTPENLLCGGCSF